MEVPRTQPHARRHALELTLRHADESAVRERWQVLERAGVRSAARHRGLTHRPHVTVVSGPVPDQEVLGLAVELWREVLPADLTVSGLVLLGGARPALADLLVADASVVAAQLRVRAAWAGSDARPWVPHVTLAPRLGPGEVARAVSVLPEGMSVVRADGLRWWDPDREVVHDLLAQES